MESIILKAIMERYGGLIPLKDSMHEDLDTVLMNLNDDVNDEFSEEEILNQIRKIL